MINKIIENLKLKYYHFLGYTKIYFFIEWYNINKIYKYKRWDNKKAFWDKIFNESNNHKYILKQYTRNWKLFKVDLIDKKKEYGF
jgi:hypothetical protein